MMMDLEEFVALLKPKREHRLIHAMEEIENLFQEIDPSVKLESSILLDLMEELTNDLSLVLDSTYVEWSVEHTINNTWDLSCQCEKINNLCQYYVVLWKHRKNEDEPYQAYPVMKWKETLPKVN